MNKEQLMIVNPHKWVKEIFDEEEEREKKYQMREIAPDFNLIKNKYVVHYLLNCPIFKELYHKKDKETTSILWRIKMREVKLNKETMEASPTLVTCLSCLRTNSFPACKTRWK
jgi:hypothetical protein